MDASIMPGWQPSPAGGATTTLPASRPFGCSPAADQQAPLLRACLGLIRHGVHPSMTREHDDAMARLNRLGDQDQEPIVIVPATPVPEPDDQVTMAMPVEQQQPYP